MAMAHDILIVDDESDIRTLVAGILEDEGYSPREAGGSDAAIATVRSRRPALVLLDIWLQGSSMDGLGVLKAIKAEYADVPVVMMSGHGTVETAVQAIKEGAYDFIEKPFKSDRLLLAVDRAIEAARLRREVEELKSRASGSDELIGESLPITQLRQTIERVAQANSRVLLHGPAGAGKEVAARTIHGNSRRADGPFVAINCATMHPERMEHELFGAEPGHEGPGSPRKIGTFELAHNGTLLLDEVADMPMETQGKIVRVLQDQTFIRVGGSLKVEVDVRVIASTTRDLQEEVTAGRFREDLFYRLNVVPIRIPPLRERRDDIPRLANHFMERAAKSAGLPPRTIGEDTFAALQTYNWPGNVRQLRNVVEWLLIMAPGDPAEPIRADLLPPEITDATQHIARWDKSGEIMNLPLREARELFEREYLLAQVTRFDGNISKTANFIGMERSALHRKLKALGVDHGD
jgi:two-component system nitrogen regulation response regulator NtrX